MCLIPRVYDNSLGTHFHKVWPGKDKNHKQSKRNLKETLRDDKPNVGKIKKGGTKGGGKRILKKDIINQLFMVPKIFRGGEELPN